MAADPALRAAYERLRDISAAVRSQAEYFRAPEHLKPGARARGARRSSPPPLPRSQRSLSPPASFIARPGEDDALVREAVAAHVRANTLRRLVDVASSDQHTVKPWFSARLPFSPTVADLFAGGLSSSPAGGSTIVGGEPVAVHGLTSGAST